MIERAKFWSDDFDVDLLKIYPNLEELLGVTAHVPLWTVGHETCGRLNGPSQWNAQQGMLSFLWLEKPVLKYEGGFTSIGSYISNKPVIECTWLEWLRDCWVHAYDFAILPEREFYQRPRMWSFDRIMYHIRGWQECQAEAEEAHQTVWTWLRVVNVRFARAVELSRLKYGEIAPYFAPGTIPFFNAGPVQRPPLPPAKSSERAA